jgi:hypothetical protein
MSDEIDIAALYREFEEALTDFVAASLSPDDETLVPRRIRMAKARERLSSHPDFEQSKYDRIILKAWSPKRSE